MATISSFNEYTVIDNVLDESQFSALWAEVQGLDFFHHTGLWNKVWQLTDPPTVSSSSFYLSQQQFSAPIQSIVEQFKNAIDSSGYYGSIGKEWDDISFTIYLNGRGSRLLTHADYPTYAGAAVYYIHPYWSSTWGGELVFPDVPPHEIVGSTNPINGPLYRKTEDTTFTKTGTGRYVTPTPNRMVLIRPRVWHRTNPVDVDAGNHLRVSISAFLLRQNTSSKDTSNVIVLGD